MRGRATERAGRRSRRRRPGPPGFRRAEPLWLARRHRGRSPRRRRTSQIDEWRAEARSSALAHDLSDPLRSRGSVPSDPDPQRARGYPIPLRRTTAGHGRRRGRRGSRVRRAGSRGHWSGPLSPAAPVLGPRVCDTNARHALALHGLPERLLEGDGSRLQFAKNVGQLAKSAKAQWRYEPHGTASQRACSV